MTAKAAQFVAPKLPTESSWPRLTKQPPVAKVGNPYSWTAVAAPTTTYTWTPVVNPAPGLTFTAAGVLQGTPTKPGTFTFAVTATSADERYVDGTFTIVVKPGPVVVTASTIVSGTLGSPYTIALTATGGTETGYTWKSTKLPPGLSLAGQQDGTARITGTPTASGVTPVTVKATDNAGKSGTTTFTINITSQPPAEPPSFVYPTNEQNLDFEGDYLFKVTAVPNADGYLFGFFQDDVLVWENFRDEGTLSGTEYGIQQDTEAHARFHPGDVDVWVRAYIDGTWTDARVITIHLI